MRTRVRSRVRETVGMRLVAEVATACGSGRLNTVDSASGVPDQPPATAGGSDRLATFASSARRLWCLPTQCRARKVHHGFRLRAKSRGGGGRSGAYRLVFEFPHPASVS